MRLTLRTMLAYLDDVLDPTDAQELEQKIEESSFASGLVHRVRDSMRRMRLGAPKLDGKGLGLDPNTVADYLDSTLAPERVPEFEKVCLESDVHLAEVASCHQVLTLVLGEPAEVDVAMRERMYRVADPIPRQPNAGIATPTNGTESMVARDVANTVASDPPVVASSARPQRASQLSTKSLAITVLLGFLIALVTLQAIGVDRLRGWVGLSSSPTIAQRPPSELGEGSEPTIEIPAETDLVPARIEDGNTISRPDMNVPIVPPAVETQPGPSSEPTVEARPVDAASESSADSPAPMDDSSASVVERPSVAGGEIAAPASVSAEGTVGEIASERSSDAPVEEPSESAEVAAVEPTRQAPVGLYISEEQVLARFDEAAGDWFRVVSDSPLLTGQRIIALPTYRPQLVLTASNIKVTLAGESHLELGRSDDTPGSRINFHSGRATIVPLGEPVNSILLDADGVTGLVSFADADSVLAVEVLKSLSPGQKPELEPATTIVQLFALSGQIAWQQDGAEELIVSAGQVLAVGADESPTLYEAGTLPRWIAGKDLTDIDGLASAELRRDLATDRPLSLSLLERTEFRQVEVRSLACRSLCSLDMFGPAIEAIDGAKLRSYWYAQFNALRGAMSRSPESAMKLQRSLEKAAGDDGGLMYELLCGFSPDQLAAGGAKKLVDALEHERVSTRVLAYENLRRITDKTQLFRPEQPPEQQKGEVMRWRRILNADGIVYKDLPRALPTRPPVAAAAAGESAPTE